MGQDLFGKQVLNTYDAIIKVGDNDTLTGIAKQLSDGRGNDAPIWLSTARMGIGITPDTNYTLTVNGAAKIGSLDVTGAVTAASVQLTGGSGNQGLLTWNTDEETVDIIQNGATLQVGQEVQVHVKNQTGALIPDGTPVYVTGTLGSSGRLTVAPMIADGSIEAKYFLGITTEDIGDGEDGKVTTFGKIRGLNTSAYSEGTTLYVSASTAGAFQTTAPAAPNLDLEVAIVITSHVNNGTIFVRATNGQYLGLLHDVYLNSPTNSQVLNYNYANSRWENTSDLSLSNLTLSGYLRGAANFVIDPAAYGDETGVVQILGDLRVDGTTTTINSTTVTIDDKNIVLASGSATAADANGAGITIDGASATMTYNSTSDRFVFNKDIQTNLVGNVTGNVIGDLTGNADTATTWETARTITIGDTGKSVDGSADVSWTKAEIGFDLQDVTDNGNTTTNSISIGKSSAPAVTLDVETSATGHMVRFKNTSSGTNGYAEMQIWNDANNKLILGSIGSGYTGAAEWEDSSYIYDTGQDALRIKASNQLELFAGGYTLSKRAIVINSDLEVGIGQVNPQYNLHIGNNGGAHVLVDGVFDDTAASSHGRIYFNDNNFGVGAGSFAASPTNDSDLYIWSYDGAGRGIRFMSTQDGSTDVTNATWKTSVEILSDTDGGHLIARNSVAIGKTSAPTQGLDVAGRAVIKAPVASFSGTVQTLLIDGDTGNGALTINSASAYAYQTFAQGGTAKFEFGIVGTAGVRYGDFYINKNIQVGELNASLSIRKTNGYVGIQQINPSQPLDVAGNVRIESAGLIFDKDNTASGGDFDFINIGYNGAWSNNVEGLAAINVNDGSGIVGKFGITYTSSRGAFVVTNLYDASGYGGSGDVFRVDGNGDAVVSRRFEASDRITLKGTTNDIIIEETTDGEWHIYDTFQDNGIILYSSTGGMEFQYNGSTEMIVDASGVRIIGGIDLSDANLDIGSADIIFGIDATDTGARGLVWNFDADGNGTASNIGYIRAGGTLVGEVMQFNMNAEGTVTGSGTVYQFMNGGTDIVTIGANGTTNIKGGLFASPDGTYDSTPNGTSFINTLASDSVSGRVVNFDGNGTRPSVWWTSENNAVGAIDGLSATNGLTFWVNSSGGSWQRNFWIDTDYTEFERPTRFEQTVNVVGNLGVGLTSAAVNKIQAVGSSTVRLESASTTSYGAGIDFYPNGTYSGYVGIPDPSASVGSNELLVYGAASASGVSLWTNTVRAMSINNSQQVGINTQSNVFGEKLTVNGWIVAGDPSSRVGLFGQDGTSVVAGAYSNNDFVIRSNNTERIRVYAGGVTRIQKTASNVDGTVQTLLVDGGTGNGAITINSASAYAYQTFAQSGTGKFEMGIVGNAGASYGDFYLNKNIQSGESGSAFYVKRTNNFVGINTTSPTFNLDVYNNADVWHASFGGATGELRIGGQTGSGAVIQSRNPSTGANRNLFIQRDGGNVGIRNGLANYMLHVGNDTAISPHIMVDGLFSNPDAAEHGRVYFNDQNFGIGAGKFGAAGTGDDDLYIWAYNGVGRDIRFMSTTNGAGAPSGAGWVTNMVIESATSGGKVGIGDATPSYKLDVNGEIRATGLVIAEQGIVGNTGSGASDKRIWAVGQTYSDWGIFYNEGSPDRIEFKSAGTTNQAIGLDGTSYFLKDVGFGNTNPKTRVHIGSLVGGDGTQQEQLRISGDYNGTGSGALIRFTNQHNSGTNPNAGEYNLGGVHAWDFRSDWGGAIGLSTAPNTSTGGNLTLRLVINPEGLVGINDNTPSYQLDVNGTIRATGDVIAYSDARVKENVHTIDNALDKVTQIRGVSYNKIGETEEKIGVIAQEIEKVLPQVVQEDDNGMKSVAYGNIVGVLIEAIKEQQKQIDELKAIINGSS